LGGVFVENVWNDVHPKGSFEVSMISQPGKNCEMKMMTSVDPNHDAKLGHFVADRGVP
jgi:hypothetical protein